MGRPRSAAAAAALLLVSCLLLACAAAGSESFSVLDGPRCLSDFLHESVCEWTLDRPLNCTAELRLAYWIDFIYTENRTCIPDNKAKAVCVCRLLTEDPALPDSFRMDLWAGQQGLLWGGNFTPSQHVKPKAPENVTVHASSHTWVLTWTSLYPLGNFLYNNLHYRVNVSEVDDPAQFHIYNVTYVDTVLRLPASILKPGRSYSARVSARTIDLPGPWSEWSASVTWDNPFHLSREQQLTLGVVLACLLILLVCLAGYLSVNRAKKLWWDQIPSPAHSSVLAVIIQDSQVSLWEKPALGQEAAERPRWKTCLAKLLPCLLEPSVETSPSFPKASGRGRRAARLARPLAEGHRTVLWPERIRVARCVELGQAPAARGDGEEAAAEDEEEEAPDAQAAEAGAHAFPEGVVARLAESLFLDLLGAEDGGSGAAGRPPPAGSMATPSPATGQALTPGPMVVEDNPAYRSFSNCCRPSAEPGGAEPGLQEAAGPERGAPGTPQTEPESWEQILRQRVLQMGAAPATGYRDFSQAVEQGAPGGGYKALSGVPARDAAGTPGACSEGGGYKPFQSPGSRPGGPVSPLPFQLELEPSRDTQVAPVPHPACLVPGEYGQKPPAAPRSPLDDLGSGIVYSALTCHLCGRLKQRCGPAERGQAPGASRPCCDCCSGDSASAPGSPPGLLGTLEDRKALVTHRGAPSVGVA